MAQGKPAEARAAYEAALKQIDEAAKKNEGGEAKGANYRELVQAKLDHVASAGVAK